MRQKTLVVALDHPFVRTPDGRVFTDLAFGYAAYWTRYMDLFDEVKVLARVSHVAEIPANAVEAGGPRLTFLPCPYFRGPKGLLRSAHQVLPAVAHATATKDAVFLLRNGNLGLLAWLFLEMRRRPFAREVQGDMGTSVALWRDASVSAGVTRLFARLSHALTRASVRRAAAVSYVSPHLADLYPARDLEATFVHSSVNLEPEAVVAPEKRRRHTSYVGKRSVLISVGRLEAEKGHDVLLRALASLAQSHPDLDWELRLVGPGTETATLQHLARSLGVSSRVRFVGQVAPGPELWQQLDDADLFILPSRTEGLPRALVEAMARSLPALASAVGGVPSLLDEAWMFPPDSPEETRDAILRAFVSQDLHAAGAENFSRVIPRFTRQNMDIAHEKFLKRILEQS